VAAINIRRVWLGALTGGIAFFVWSMVMEFGVSYALVGTVRMDIAANAGWFLKEPRVPLGLALAVWTVSLFVIAFGLAWLYAAMRATVGAGPATAAKLGLIVGFAAGFPMEFMHTAFQPLSARYGILWMIEMGVGCILAALAAGWVYRDAPAQG
jgi:uncharacterized membrane protein YczE